MNEFERNIEAPNYTDLTFEPAGDATAVTMPSKLITFFKDLVNQNPMTDLMLWNPDTADIMLVALINITPDSKAFEAAFGEVYSEKFVIYFDEGYSFCSIEEFTPAMVDEDSAAFCFDELTLIFDPDTNNICIMNLNDIIYNEIDDMEVGVLDELIKIKTKNTELITCVC